MVKYFRASCWTMLMYCFKPFGSNVRLSACQTGVPCDSLSQRTIYVSATEIQPMSPGCMKGERCVLAKGPCLFKAHAQIIPSCPGPHSMSGRGEIEADDIWHVIFLAQEKDRENLQGVPDDPVLKTVAHSFAIPSLSHRSSMHLLTARIMSEERKGIPSWKEVCVCLPLTNCCP